MGLNSPFFQSCLDSIEERKPGVVLTTRRFWDDVLAKLDTLNPTFSPNEKNVDASIMEAIAYTLPIVGEVAQVAQHIVATNSEDAAQEIYQSFEQILQRYDTPLDSLPSSRPDIDFAFFQFVGYDLFVTFMAPFIRYEKWGWIRKLLNTEFNAGNFQTIRQLPANFSDLSVFNKFLKDRAQRINFNHYSPQGALIEERHTSKEIAKFSSFADFVSTDVFLYLCGQFQTPRRRPRNMDWKPWTSIYTTNYPMPWLNKVSKLSFAKGMSVALGLPSELELKQRLPDEMEFLGRLWGDSIDYEPPQISESMIASRF